MGNFEDRRKFREMGWVRILRTQKDSAGENVRRECLLAREGTFVSHVKVDWPHRAQNAMITSPWVGRPGT